jgi:DNA-binding transcriptional ArsR family regulator
LEVEVSVRRRSPTKEHVGVLEQAGLVTTKKIGRVRTYQLGPRRLEEEMAWLERYRHRWAHASTSWTGLSRN